MKTLSMAVIDGMAVPEITVVLDEYKLLIHTIREGCDSVVKWSSYEDSIVFELGRNLGRVIGVMYRSEAALAPEKHPLCTALLVVVNGAIRLHEVKIVEGNGAVEDRKSTRLNSSHITISYAVFCLKKKKKSNRHHELAK